MKKKTYEEWLKAEQKKQEAKNYLTEEEFRRRRKREQLKAKVVQYANNFYSSFGSFLGHSDVTPCANCGAPMQVNGEHYRCPRCGRHVIIKATGEKIVLRKGR